MILAAVEPGGVGRQPRRVRAAGIPSTATRSRRSRAAPARARIPRVTAPRSGGDHRTILTGTIANVVGLLVGVRGGLRCAGTARARAAVGGLGVVTLAVQVAFVASAGGRFGMDMTAIRRVAIARSGTRDTAQPDRPRAGVATAASTVSRAWSPPPHRSRATRRTRSLWRRRIPPSPPPTCIWERPAASADEAHAVGVLDRPAGALDLPPRSRSRRRRDEAAVAAYGARGWSPRSPPARSGGRSPPAWATGAPRGAGSRGARATACRGRRRRCSPRRCSGPTCSCWGTTSGQKLDAYAAAGRVSQVLLLFVISTSLIFSPFAAELHARGDTGPARSAVQGRDPVGGRRHPAGAIILFVAAADVLRVFGSDCSRARRRFGSCSPARP